MERVYEWAAVWKFVFAKANPPQKWAYHNMPKTQQHIGFLSLEPLQEDVLGFSQRKVEDISQSSSTNIIINT